MNDIYGYFMKMKLILVFVLVVFVIWVLYGMVCEVVVFFGVVGVEGVLNGVDMMGNVILIVVNNQNININNDFGGVFMIVNNN